MDESGSGYSLKAPGPGPFPGVDDHLVEGEVTRDEMIGGRRMVAPPVPAPHADRQAMINGVIASCAASGYRVAIELLTRVDEDSDFGTDVCVRRAGVDPATGARYLEEMAFEVVSVSEQNEEIVTEKALRMCRRGVRRFFAIFLESSQVCEWSAENGSWRVLDSGSQIEDPCLVISLPVTALLDRGVAAVVTVKGLAAQGNPELQRRLEAAESRGKAKGWAEGLAESRL